MSKITKNILTVIYFIGFSYAIYLTLVLLLFGLWPLAILVIVVGGFSVYGFIKMESRDSGQKCECEK